MKLITRKCSIIDGDDHMEELLRLKNFPMYMGVTEQDKKNDLFYDLIYEINTTNGEVQIRDLISEDDLYKEAHYNNIGNGWRDHHRAFAEFLAKFRPKKIFEIGGGRGILSVEYMKLDDANWTILDPVPNPVSECKAQYVKGFFDNDYKIGAGYDAVVYTHTLEHFYDPIRCITNIGNNMKNGSWMFFSIPNMEEMVKRCYTNVMNFEHTFYCAEPYVSYICSVAGYNIMESKKFKEDHSIFYAARKQEEYQQRGLLNAYSINKKLFLDWGKKQKNITDYYNSKMENILPERKVYLFGAHVNTQFLLAFQLRTDKIKGILDNDISKQGKRLYGTPFQVCSTESLKNQYEPIVILRSGTHNGEIKEKILKVNPMTEIWEE